MHTERAALAALVAPRQTAVLVVDVQPMFTAMPLCPPLAEVLPNLRRFLDAARAAGVCRVFIRHVIPAERWTAVWQEQHPDRVKAALAPDSALSTFDPGFEPEADDLVVIKQRYSGFVGTGLAELLRERSIRTVVLVGLTTDICMSSTARDAFHNELHTVTLADCTAEQTLARHEAGLASLAACFGRVCTSADDLAAWQAQPILADGAQLARNRSSTWAAVRRASHWLAWEPGRPPYFLAPPKSATPCWPLCAWRAPASATTSAPRWCVAPTPCCLTSVRSNT